MHKVIEVGLEKTIYQPVFKPIAKLLLAHGAGAGNKHEFMHQYASLMVDKGVEVHSINFPYMQLVYELEKKRPPNSNKILTEYFCQLIEQQEQDLPLFLAGKSMGGRIATQVAADKQLNNQIKGVIALGYPFIPPGKPEKLQQRMAHFEAINVNTLILQGERDPFGNVDLLNQLHLPLSFTLEWITSGEHSFKPLRSSGVSFEHNMNHAVELSHQFINLQLGL